MQSTQAVPREARKAARRDLDQEQIRAIALDAFAAHGYEGTCMQEVAKRAGFSVGHIYNVIGNKEHLFDEVMYRGGKALECALNDRVVQLQNRPPVERLDGLFSEILVFFDEHPKIFQLFLSEANADVHTMDSHFSKRVVAIQQRIQELVRSLFEASQKDQSVVGLDAEDMTMASLQLVNGFLTRWARTGYSTQARSKTETIRQMIWHGLRHETVPERSTP